MKKRKHRVSNVLLVLILLTGIAIVAYPTFSDYWNSMHQSRAIMGYAERVAELDNEAYTEIWDDAIEYNRRLQYRANRWAIPDDEAALEEYNAELNVDGTGNMGFVTIPKTDTNLPLYHGTEESILQTSIGHIEGTSLPCGSLHPDEENFSRTDFPSHCVLSGHRGLPSAKLFTDLDKLEVGDIFYLTVLDQTLTYEIDRITVIEPTDMKELELIPGMDLCTLMTCTPYGINTHRLLVRGQRIENEKKKLDVRVTADALKISPIEVAPFIAAPILLLMVVWILIITSGRRRS
ncbi:MAG: class C sortase [Clostridia bacterium]|nr:class C sortase [Clostridia bacterium]